VEWLTVETWNNMQRSTAGSAPRSTAYQSIPLLRYILLSQARSRQPERRGRQHAAPDDIAPSVGLGVRTDCVSRSRSDCQQLASRRTCRWITWPA